MLKLASGKRWDVSRHNSAVCLLCDEKFTDQRHPLMTCTAYEVQNARQRWRELISDQSKAENMWLRTQMEEFVRCIFNERDGELAAVGTFTPRWVDKLDKEKEFTALQMSKMKKLMSTMASLRAPFGMSSSGTHSVRVASVAFDKFSTCAPFASSVTRLVVEKLPPLFTVCVCTDVDARHVPAASTTL